MSSGVPTNSARRTVSFAAGAVIDADGIKTAFATSASPVTVLPASFNGAVVSTSTGVISPLPRTITIARSSSVGSYTVDPIVITGRRSGSEVTESLTPGNANGNDMLRGTQAFESITSIAFPAQVNASGAFTIGVQDICAPSGGTFTAVKLDSDGPLNVQYGDRSGSNTDTITAKAGILEPIAPSRVLTSPALSAPTVAALTVYLP